MAKNPFRLAVAALFCALALAGPASAHPHVFAEARLDVMLSADGKNIDAFRHLWRFDDMFTATVIMEFDKNGDNKLDDAELEEVRKVTYQSMAEFNYFQMVTADGKDVPLNAPDEFGVMIQDNRLIFLFKAKPKAPLSLAGKIDVGVYDPTFYTAIEFVDDKDMALSAHPENCAHKVVRPDPDEVIAQNQQTLDEAFFNDPGGNDMTKMFATRLELNCQKSHG